MAPGGNNTLLLTATDAAGNVSTTSIVLVRSAVTITLNSLGPEDLGAASATVSVNIGSTTGYTLWMNGVKATDEGAGNWAAGGVPLPQGGPILVEVCAIPNTDNNGNGIAGSGQPPTYQDLGNPTSAQALKVDFSADHQPFVYAQTYNEKWTETATFKDPQPYDEYSSQIKKFSWAFGSGGSGRLDRYVAATGEDIWETWNWPADPGWPLTERVTVTSGDPSGPQPPTTADPALPIESCEVTVNTTGASTSDSYTRTAHTTLWLWTGTTSDPSHHKLFCISANAVRVLEKKWRYDSGSPLADLDKVAVLPRQIEIGGLGTLGADGNLWVVLPDKANINITPRVSGVNYYAFSADQQKYRLWVCANGLPTAGDHITPDARFCVGQQVTFSPAWSPAPPPFTGATYLWVLPDKYVNESWQNQVWVPTGETGGYWEYYGSLNYRINPDLLTHQTTQCWFVNQPSADRSDGVATLGVDLALPNGQNVMVAASGRIDISRPRVTALETLTPPIQFTWSVAGALVEAKIDCNWTARVSVPPKFSGTATYTQLIQRNTAYQLSGHIAPTTDTTDGQFWLDSNDPYAKDAQPALSWTDVPPGPAVSHQDSPGYGPSAFIGSLAIDDHFQTYLRFQPAGGIRVTIDRIDWTWTVNASEDNGAWSELHQVTGPTEHRDDDSFPEWTDTYHNQN